MGDKSDQIRELKKLVLAYLQPYSGGRPIRDLLSDFRNNEGRPLPFGELGYPTAEHLLREMSDICTLKFERGEMHVWGLASECLVEF